MEMQIYDILAKLGINPDKVELRDIDTGENEFFHLSKKENKLIQRRTKKSKKRSIKS